MKKNQNGFIWQELVIVVAVTGVLALVAGLLIYHARQETRDIKRLSDVKTIQHALELYFYDCNLYPSEIVPTKPISGEETCQGNVYLQYAPYDPKGTAYGYLPCRDVTLVECEPGITNPGGYKLYYELESNTDGIAKGLHMAVPGKFLAQ